MYLGILARPQPQSHTNLWKRPSTSDRLAIALPITSTLVSGVSDTSKPKLVRGPCLSLEPRPYQGSVSDVRTGIVGLRGGVRTPGQVLAKQVLAWVCRC